LSAGAWSEELPWPKIDEKGIVMREIERGWRKLRRM